MSSKEDIFKKWAPLLDSVGVTASQWSNMAQLAENQSNHILEENTLASDTTSMEFPSILPMAMKVAAKTIGSEIGGFASQEEIREVKNRIQSENRDGKIVSIVEGTEFTEKKLEDDPEYQTLMKKGVTPLSAPSGKLFYLDFKYSDNSDKKDIDNV